MFSENVSTLAVKITCVLTSKKYYLKSKSQQLLVVLLLILSHLFYYLKLRIYFADIPKKHAHLYDTLE